MNSVSIKVIVYVIISMFTILGAVWAIEDRYASEKELELAMDSVSQTFQTIQKGSKLQSLYDRLFYWERTEREIKMLIFQYPSNVSLKIDYDNAKDEVKRLKQEIEKLR